MPSRQGLDAAYVGVETSCTDAYHRVSGVFFHSGGIGGDIPDGDSLKDHKLNEPPEDAVSQRDSGEACCDAGGKGVHRGGDDTRSGPQQDHRHRLPQRHSPPPEK